MKLLSLSVVSALLSFSFVCAHAAPSNQDKVNSSFSNIARSTNENDVYETTVLGETYYASKDVFSPKYFKSTEMITENFPFRKNETFLEMGCGVGVASVVAAKQHNNEVLAVDVNPMAVQITAMNALKHDVHNKLKVLQSDVFSNVPSSAKFDTIFWDLPYVYSENAQDKNLTLLQRSVSDPGYKHIDTFLSQARNHLSDEGRIIVGFGSNGDLDRFSQLVSKHQYTMEKIYEGYNPYREGITYQLFVLNNQRSDVTQMG